MRNSVTNFQMAIKNYLDELAMIDQEFAEKYNLPEKSIEQCCAFIISEMKKSALNGAICATDDEVYGIAVQYYWENEVKMDSCSSGNVTVVSNQYIDLTEQEKAEARQMAIQQYQKEELQKLQNRKKQIVKKELKVEPSLFD